MIIDAMLTVVTTFIHWVWHGHVAVWRPCCYNGIGWDYHCWRCTARCPHRR